MFDLCFCVVLYKKQPVDSETISSLIDNLPNLNANSIVVVFNNGPEISKNDNIPDFITIHQVLINGSLSKIYNKTLELYQANKYVFFDDDTCVNSCYLTELNCKKFKIFFPEIFCQSIKHYPVINKNGIQTITSGLAISHDAIIEIKDINGFVFDESFDLYGIDTAFCYFINEHSFEYTVSKSALEHQLSHISGASGEFRRKEVFLANAAALIKYFNVRLLLQTMSSTLWAIRKFRFNLLCKAFLSFLLGYVIR
ncbi:hypothetical protein ACPW74_05395 [Aeromonas sp. INTO2]|uniref:hypothetical protein n=1 Tax=Aeromonas sp. INTO2 TaxID=3416714 RepID=UPI003CFAE8B4